MSLDIKDMYKLTEPFSSADVEWRIGRDYYNEEKKTITAKALAYIKQQPIHRRLDNLCGMDGWYFTFNEWKEGAIATLYILIKYPDGSTEWRWKSGGANPTNFEGFKGMLTVAEKRAAVQWGIGRYLYDIPETKVNVVYRYNPDFVRGVHKRKNQRDIVYWWEIPELPEWAVPFEESYEISTIVEKIKNFVSGKNEWDNLKHQLRSLYHSNDVNYIIMSHGKEILEQLEKGNINFKIGQ